MNGQKNAWKPAMTLKAAVHLAAPHTWSASVLPVLLGSALAAARGSGLKPWIVFLTLIVAVLLQSAVNTLNDYRDFVSGVDTAENCLDETDAALIYECSSPKAAACLGLLFLLCAAVFGAVLTALCSWRMLLYGAAALAALLLYTLPRISFSALPLGELLSGGAMGGVLTCAAYHAQTGSIDWLTVFYTLPAVITIGGIMQVNNTCDIEKDREGKRYTLPVLIGRSASEKLLRALLVLAAAGVGLIIALRFPAGDALLPVMILALLLAPSVREIFVKPISPERRGESMRGVLSAHKLIISCYTMALVFSCLA